MPVSAAANAASYGLAWWLYPTGKSATPFYLAGSGFGGQIPVAMVEQDMVVVFNAWNLLPGRPSMPGRRMMDRLAAAAQRAGTVPESTDNPDIITAAMFPAVTRRARCIPTPNTFFARDSL